MKIDPALKRDFKINLIATLIIILLIEPISKSLWPLVLNFGSLCFKNYLDYLFQLSAKGNADFASLYTFLFVLWGVLGLVFFSYVETRTRFKKILKGDNQNNRGERVETPSEHFLGGEMRAVLREATPDRTRKNS